MSATTDAGDIDDSFPFTKLMGDLQMCIINKIDNIYDLLALSITSRTLHAFVFSARCCWASSYHLMFKERAAHQQLLWGDVFKKRYLMEARRAHKAIHVHGERPPISVTPLATQSMWSHFYLAGAALFEGSHWFEMRIDHTEITQIGWFSYGMTPSTSRGIGDSCGLSYDGSRSCIFAGEELELDWTGTYWKKGDLIRSLVDIGKQGEVNFRFWKNGVDLGEVPTGNYLAELPLYAGFTCKGETKVTSWSAELRGPLVECYSRLSSAKRESQGADEDNRRIQLINAPLVLRHRLVLPALRVFIPASPEDCPEESSEWRVHYRFLRGPFIRLLNGNFCEFDSASFLTEHGQSFCVPEEARGSLETLSLFIQHFIQGLPWFRPESTVLTISPGGRRQRVISVSTDDAVWSFKKLPLCVEVRL